MLSDEELLRYSRQILLKQVDIEGQLRLKQSRALIVGLGGLGSPVALYLAAAGVGELHLADFDTLDLTNLQRQIAHDSRSLGLHKVDSAMARLEALNPHVRLIPYRSGLDADSLDAVVAQVDLVLDCTDNFTTRYLASDAAEITGTPLVWGTILQYQGQLSVFWPDRGPMLRDLFPEVPAADSVPSAVVGGTFGPVVGQVGSMMATEAVKVLTGIGTPAVGKLVVVDALGVGARTLSFAADPDRASVTQLPEAE